jgi:hypothetical protein
VAAGFGVFFVVRVPLAAIPFTGQPFFPAELSLSLPNILAVAVVVPVAAAAVARLALRRVTISPLGVTRRVTPAPPRAWRVLPLLVGLAYLGFFVVHGRPASIPVLAQLGRISGVRGIVEVRADPGLTMSSPQLGIPSGFAAAVVSCAQLATTPALGQCPAGAAAAKVSPFLTTGHFADRSLAGITWPTANVPASRLARLPLYSLDVATNGTLPAIEEARTVLDDAYPTGVGSPNTLGEDTTAQNAADNGYQQLADMVILISLAIAGCTMAASVTAGLADRKRPFSLLRLTGARLGLLRRVIVMESAVPLLAAAAIAIGTGFGASAMFTIVQLAHPLVAPDAAYYVITAAGIVLALGVIAATFPLLRRITGPETARSE